MFHMIQENIFKNLQIIPNQRTKLNLVCFIVIKYNNIELQDVIDNGNETILVD